MFTLFHGQSSVERRFTVNKQFFIANLKEKPLTALRWVEEHMSASDKTPKEVQITRDMLHYVKVDILKKTFPNNGRRRKMRESH